MSVPRWEARQGAVPSANPAQALGMQHGRNDGAAVLQRPHDVLLRHAQRVKVAARAQLPGSQQNLRQRGRVRQALQHAVHEAGVAQVLQPRTLHVDMALAELRRSNVEIR